MMAWVRVTQDFDYPVPGRAGRSWQAFKAGSEVSATRAAVDAIVAAGAGEEIEHPADKKSDKSGKTVDRKAVDTAEKPADA